MKTKYIALSPVYSTDSNLINQATYNSDYKSLRCLNWNVPLGDRKNVVAVYGEDFFTTHVANQCGFTLENVESNWLTTLPQHYLKRHITHQKLKDVSVTNSFIKPVDAKYFKAGIYKSKDAIHGYDSLDKNQDVYTSTVVEWDCEIRTFVLDNTIETLSTYLVNGDYILSKTIPKDNKGFIAFTEAFLKDTAVKLPKAIVVDFGYIKNSGWAVIEANPVYSSGIYACNPEKVLDTIVKSCK